VTSDRRIDETDGRDGVTPCACTRGLPCDGPVATFRRQDKHGASVVTSYPDCLCRGGDYANRAPMGTHYTAPQTGPKASHGAVSYPAGPFVGRANPTDPNAPVSRCVDLDRGWTRQSSLHRRGASQATRDAAHRAETQRVTIPAPKHRSIRATLNTTRRGAATIAAEIREVSRNADRNATTPPLTGRERRNAKREAHRARIAHMRGDETR
jgi:hypothetical protein